jgi:translation initiation factor IF-3
MSDAIKIKGTIIKIGEAQEFGAKGFRKSEMILRIDEDSKYPQEIPVEWHGEKADEIPRLFGEGDEVEVCINLRGREYNGRHYINVVGWRVDALNGSGTGNTQPIEQAHDDDEMGPENLPF